MKTQLKFLILFLSFAIAPAGAMANMVGAIMPTKKIPHYEAIHDALVGELGSSAEVLLQKPAAAEMAWKNATRKLSTLESKVIVAYGSATALAISKEDPDMPVVYVGAYDPAGVGVAGKVTGMDGTVPLKGLVGNLKKIANFSKLAILYSHEEPDTVKQMEVVAELAGKLGAEAIKIDTFGVDDFDFGGADAVFMTAAADINTKKSFESIIEKAKAGKIPTAAVLSGTCELGAIISLAANPEQQGKGAAKMVSAILGGKSPADIPPDTSPKVELTINLKEAKELGLNIPFELLGTAKVIK